MALRCLCLVPALQILRPGARGGKALASRAGCSDPDDESEQALPHNTVILIRMRGCPNNDFVIASAAKRSRLRCGSGLLRRCAPRNDSSVIASAAKIPARRCDCRSTRSLALTRDDVRPWLTLVA